MQFVLIRDSSLGLTYWCKGVIQVSASAVGAKEGIQVSVSPVSANVWIQVSI